jgi:hypothetical protein
MVIICICNAIRRNKAENDEETTPNQPTVSCITTTNLHSMFYRITYKTEVNITKGPLWLRSYGSWIYNYLCNQYISPLTLWVRIPPRRGVLVGWFGVVSSSFSALFRLIALQIHMMTIIRIVVPVILPNTMEATAPADLWNKHNVYECFNLHSIY